MLTEVSRLLYSSEHRSALFFFSVFALACGALLEGSAVMAFFVHVGVGELHHLWWLPLGLGALVKARRTKEWQWFFAVSVILIFAMISCFYLGFFYNRRQECERSSR